MHFLVDITVTGCSNVPIAIELAFRHGGKLEGVEQLMEIKDAYFLKFGIGKYSSGSNFIEFGPGYHKHEWTQLRNAQPKLDAMSVYLTGISPENFTIKIGNLL